MFLIPLARSLEISRPLPQAVPPVHIAACGAPVASLAFD